MPHLGKSVLTALALVCTVTAPAEASATIDWCPDSEVQCGSLRLPVDWARPRGDQFTLAIARRRAPAATRIGVLMINPGGPGDSGVDFTRRADKYFSPEVLARFDIVGFDPRGVREITCSPEILARQPSQYPQNQDEFDRLAAYNQELRLDCRRRSGAIFDHADTLSVIQDMDALRRALGERQISYFGHSYGTLFGQQYAERYGSRIRAMVLTANIDHSLGVQEFLESSAVAAEDSFTEFVTWCDRTPSCALHGRDVPSFWDALLARADRGELGMPASDIIGRAVSMFKGPQWSELASWLSGLNSGEPVAKPPLLLAAFCEDWQVRVRDYAELASLTSAELRLAPHMRGTTAHALVGCIGWPPANNPQHRLRITDSPKILMLNSLHDPVSPHVWAANAHSQARNSTVLLTYEGWGHQVYKRNDCTISAVNDYLIDLSVPRDGTRCAAN